MKKNKKLASKMKTIDFIELVIELCRLHGIEKVEQNFNSVITWYKSFSMLIANERNKTK